MFRRRSRCERSGHDYGGVFAGSFPVCKRCGHVEPPPKCWHCGQGTFCEPEPIFGALCCDRCGHSVVDTPGSLPSFDNAGSISMIEDSPR